LTHSGVQLFLPGTTKSNLVYEPAIFYFFIFFFFFTGPLRNMKKNWQHFDQIFNNFLTNFWHIFTRCDKVGTWSREYQLSSSSYSHSHSYSYSYSNSYSPDDSLFFGFLTSETKILTTFLTTFWQLFWQLFDQFLTTFWQLFDIFFTFFDNFLTTLWPLLTSFDNFLTFFHFDCASQLWQQIFWNKFIYAVPTSLLIAPGLWTIQFLLFFIFDKFSTIFWQILEKEFWNI
jgi:hypothetical protein